MHATTHKELHHGFCMAVANDILLQEFELSLKLKHEQDHLKLLAVLSGACARNFGRGCWCLLVILCDELFSSTI